jgi:hypothetical protein
VGSRRILALADSNGIPAELAAAARDAVLGVLTRAAPDATLEGILSQARDVASRWFADHDLPTTGCFVNLALIEPHEDSISIAGAYAPVYVLSPGRPTRYTDFPGPVIGPAGMLRHPARTLKIHVDVHEHVLVPSDGLLESRTLEGRINGDSHLKRSADALLSSPDVHAAVLELYRKHDAEDRDSRSLLTMTRTR